MHKRPSRLTRVPVCLLACCRTRERVEMSLRHLHQHVVGVEEAAVGVIGFELELGVYWLALLFYSVFVFV